MARMLVALFLLAGLARPAQADLVLTMGGDVNFNKDRMPPSAQGAPGATNALAPWSSFTSGIRHLIDGDLNFANIETVVTDRRDLKAQPKAFAFQTHPEAIRHLTAMGFNLFSLANNHSYDYGFAGLQETKRVFDGFGRDGRVHAHGIGDARDGAAEPAVFQVQGYTVAFAAIGIIDPAFRAGPARMGVLNFRDDSDYNLVLTKLKGARADFKILSIHYGTEKQVRLDAGQQARFRRAIDEGDADLIIGHHPHVVRPVEMHKGRLIIYSLGNYMMVGAADITGRPVGFDYGLFGRLYLDWDSALRRLKAQALEAVALTQMRYRARPMDAAKGAERIRFLNDLSRREVGSRAVIFAPRTDGSGVACGTEILPGSRAERVCPRAAAPAVILR